MSKIIQELENTIKTEELEIIIDKFRKVLIKLYQELFKNCKKALHLDINLQDVKSLEDMYVSTVKLYETARPVFKKIFEENAKLHNLVNKILSEYDSGLELLGKLMSILERKVEKLKSGEVEGIEDILSTWYSAVNYYRRGEVLSIEIDECVEMRKWRGKYLEIRKLYYMIATIIYYLILMLKLSLIETKFRHVMTRDDIINSLLNDVKILKILLSTLEY